MAHLMERKILCYNPLWTCFCYTSKKDTPDTVWMFGGEERKKVYLNGLPKSGNRFCLFCFDPH